MLHWHLIRTIFDKDPCCVLVARDCRPLRGYLLCMYDSLASQTLICELARVRDTNQARKGEFVRYHLFLSTGTLVLERVSRQITRDCLPCWIINKLPQQKAPVTMRAEYFSTRRLVLSGWSHNPKYTAKDDVLLVWQCESLHQQSETETNGRWSIRMQGKI